MLRSFARSYAAHSTDKALREKARLFGDAMQAAAEMSRADIRKAADDAETDLYWVERFLQKYMAGVSLLVALTLWAPAYMPLLHLPLSAAYSPWFTALVVIVFSVGLFRGVYKMSRGKRPELYQKYEMYRLAQALQDDAEKVMNAGLALQTHIVLEDSKPRTVLNFEKAYLEKLTGNGQQRKGRRGRGPGGRSPGAA